MSERVDSMPDLELARYNMIEQQIRTWEVLDQRVLDLLHRVHREEFVPAQYRGLAFVDMGIPIGHGEHMLQPKVEARMVQELMLAPSDRVLEIGTGSGYMTALLASVAAHVYSVDIHEDFVRAASERLARAAISNVTLETGDAASGWDKHGPYDAIVLTGSVPVLPAAFKASLKTGGRLLAVVGEAPVMEAQLITAMDAGAFNVANLFETCLEPLKNVARREKFVF